MKNQITFIKAALILCCLFSWGQLFAKEKIAVLRLDVKGVRMEPAILGNITRIYLEKLDSFEVFDPYDIDYLLRQDSSLLQNCYGKMCLIEVGKKIGADKMMSGAVEQHGNMLVITLRMVDIKEETILKTSVRNFLVLPGEITSMLEVMVNDIMGKPNNEVLVTQLTKKVQLENAVNTPYSPQLKVNGPRMGYAFFTGKTADVLSSPKDQGGYAAYPAMFQFGYQFEKQYLNEGNFQALFEFIPMISGIEQGRFVPSFSLMNGLRSNLSGWELAFGPNFSIVRMNYGMYDNERWVTEDEWRKSNSHVATAPAFEKRLDSRGTAELNASFVIGVGKTFRSGKLNIPVNIFVLPKKNETRFGISFGYNSRNY